MRRWIVTCLAGLPFACGCAQGTGILSKTQKASEEAHVRWNKVRARVKLQLAQAQYDAQHLNESLRELEEALSLDPDNADACVLLARIRLEQNRIPDARQALEHAARIQPDHAEAAYVAGIVAQRCDDWSTALSCYTRAAGLRPAEADYVAAAAEALMAMNRAPEALALIESRLSDFDDDARLRFLSAQVHSELGLSDAAAERMRQAARAADNDRAIQAALGLALAEAGRDVEAVGVLAPLYHAMVKSGATAAKERNQPGGDARCVTVSSAAVGLILARCHYQLGNLNEARRCLADLIGRDPDDAQAWLLLARVASDQNDGSAASEAAENAVRLAGHHAATHLVAALIWLRDNELDRAADAAKRAATLDRNDPTSLCLLGRAREAAGLDQQASEAYAQALVRDPRCELARALLDRLTARSEKLTPPPQHAASPTEGAPSFEEGNAP